MTTVLHIGHVEIVIDDEHQHLTTRFEDGTQVPATPNHDPASVALAHQLGYHGDTWRMSLDHELCHVWRAYEGHHDAHGQPGWTSPTLWWLAHNEPIIGCRAELVRWEEAAVLKMQAELDKTTDARPWDKYRVASEVTIP